MVPVCAALSRTAVRIRDLHTDVEQMPCQPDHLRGQIP
jgi:hypothetical protein